jgi:hypothetical protein
MKKVYINGWTFYIDGDKVYNEEKTSFTTFKFLTANEMQQINKQR